MAPVELPSDEKSWFFLRKDNPNEFKLPHFGDSWSADLPLLDTKRPLWVYANVHYSLEKPITGAGYISLEYL
ncbi:MAG: hypothetical protein PF904_01255 [Kiritimatiellae bacterium]|nr:hypothetical protein [Kiritimatiellia bacterium]